MEVSEAELRDRYRITSTDKLLAIAQSDGLTEVAQRLLAEELSDREISDEDLSHAERAEAVMEADRATVRKSLGRSIRRALISLALIAILGIYLAFNA